MLGESVDLLVVALGGVLVSSPRVLSICHAHTSGPRSIGGYYFLLLLNRGLMVVATAVVILNAAHKGTSRLFLYHVMLVLKGFLKFQSWEHSSHGPSLPHFVWSCLIVILEC